MKNLRSTLLITVFLASILLYSCNDGSSKKAAEKDSPAQAAIQVANNFFLHYWDKLDMLDTAANQKTEQQLVDFIGLMAQTADSAKRDQAVANMLDKVKTKRPVFDRYVKLLETYLYEGNSPLRSDVLYESLLRYLINTEVLSDLEKQSYRPIYELIRRNKVGEKAQDFSVELADGTKQQLSQIKSKYTFILFYDPDCPHCKEAIKQLRDTPELVQLFKQMQVQILSVDPSGKQDRWRDHLIQLPPNWINGLDRERTLKKEYLYDLKASPTMYLLDENKKVLLKDAYLDQIIQFFLPQN